MLNFDWLSGVSQENAKLIFYGFFCLIGLMVVLIPTEYAYEGVPKDKRHWYNNLKLWGLTVLGILSFVYSRF